MELHSVSRFVHISIRQPLASSFHPKNHVDGFFSLLLRCRNLAVFPSLRFHIRPVGFSGLCFNFGSCFSFGCLSPGVADHPCMLFAFGPIEIPDVVFGTTSPPETKPREARSGASLWAFSPMASNRAPSPHGAMRVFQRSWSRSYGTSSGRGSQTDEVRVWFEEVVP